VFCIQVIKNTTKSYHSLSFRVHKKYENKKWEKDYEPTTIKSNDKVMFQVKCADCGCFPKECKISPSAKECPNCSWDECCCWATIVNR